MLFNIFKIFKKDQNVKPTNGENETDIVLNEFEERLNEARKELEKVIAELEKLRSESANSKNNDG